MDRINKTAAILFIDICDSTKLFEILGDVQAMEMTSQCLKRMERFVVREDGIVQETRGDGLLCKFDGVRAALKAAQAIQNTYQGGLLAVHAGIHFGPVIFQEGALYGTAVNIAARMMEIAKRGETIISEDAWQKLPGWKQETLRALGRVMVKGKSRLIRIYLAVPNAMDQTSVQLPQAKTQTGKSILRIDDGKNKHCLEAPAANFVFGRHHDCDLIVNHKYVSRHHATIECTRGKFFLLDHSTNGCYVNEDDQAYKFLRRDMLQLHGQGTLSLGIDPAKNSKHLIYYRCED